MNVLSYFPSIYFMFGFPFYFWHSLSNFHAEKGRDKNCTENLRCENGLWDALPFRFSIFSLVGCVAPSHFSVEFGSM